MTEGTVIQGRSYMFAADSRVVGQYQRAQRSLAGGVSSSTRVNKALGHPLYFARASGCRVWDLDGKEYYRSLLQPRRDAFGTRRRARAAQPSTRLWRPVRRCSYENEQHAELAELLCDTIPCLRACPLHRVGYRSDDARHPARASVHGPLKAPEDRRAIFTATMTR